MTGSRIQAMLVLAALLLGACLAPRTAAAREDVQSDLSAHDIAIESNFTGARIVVFGTIENGNRSVEEAKVYDVVVVIRGPSEPVVSRRKTRVLGIWINSNAQTFEDVPGYYAVLSTRPLSDIAKPNVLAGRGIGQESLLPIPESLADQSPAAVANARVFREAIIRIKEHQRHFIDDERGVIFVSKTLFRATLDLPANVSDGDYLVDVFLFRNGRLLSINQRNLTIYKQGFERFIYTAAFDYPLAYGIVAVLVAIAVGLSASAVFRRD